MHRKNLPIGYDNFKEILDNNMYYVDKTLIIDELIVKPKKVFLFPRPRRFGKSLFISMLDNFFNVEYKEENQELFNGLKISKCENYKYLSSYPVIKLNFKKIDASNYEKFYNDYKVMIINLYKDKKYLLDNLDIDDKNLYNLILSGNVDETSLQQALPDMTRYLYNYYHKKVIVLIDEYDVPIQDAYLNNCYDDIMKFIKKVFNDTLKYNDYAEKSILTGVMRVSGESLFSDLNNVDIYSVVDAYYNEYFGFTREETNELLNYYDLELSEDVKNMYDGYNFNGVDIYNPWSILKYADRRELNYYWTNTSSNSLIVDLLERTNDDIKDKIEKLINGDSIEFNLNEKITFPDLEKNNSLNIILSFLLICGYVTLSKEGIENKEEKPLNTIKCCIPNEELRHTFIKILEDNIINESTLENTDLYEFKQAIINDDKVKMEKLLNELLRSMSYNDKHEKFYHGYLLGLFASFVNKFYEVKSNRESGEGRFDIMIRKKDNSVGAVLELKVSKRRTNLESVAIKALNQINDKEYYEILNENNVKIIHKYSVVFYGKKCIVR